MTIRRLEREEKVSLTLSLSFSLRTGMPREKEFFSRKIQGFLVPSLLFHLFLRQMFYAILQRLRSLIPGVFYPGLKESAFRFRKNVRGVS